MTLMLITLAYLTRALAILIGLAKRENSREMVNPADTDTYSKSRLPHATTYPPITSALSPPPHYNFCSRILSPATIR